MTAKTSRSTIIDAIELLTNQIALCSHCQELINTYISDLKIATTDTERENFVKKIDQQKIILEKAIEFRRSLTARLFEEI